MTDTELERQLTDALMLLRESIGFSRARFYAMDETGSFRLAASYGFPARFGPEDVLGIGDPLIEWVHFHRKPMYANSMKDAGPLARVMERESYARLLAAPISVGSRVVGIVELQDKVAGGLFTQDDARVLDRAIGPFAIMLRANDAGGIAAGEPIDPEDAVRLFHDVPQPDGRPRLRRPPPDLYDRPEDEAGARLAAAHPGSGLPEPKVELSRKGDLRLSRLREHPLPVSRDRSRRLLTLGVRARRAVRRRPTALFGGWAGGAPAGSRVGRDGRGAAPRHSQGEALQHRVPVRAE